MRGIRRALGATARDLITSVMRQGFAIAMVGVGLGLLVTWYGTRFIASLLFPGMPVIDPLALGSAALALTLVALAASRIPALMAARADPRSALQAE